MRTKTTLGLGLDHHDEVLAGLRRGDGASARAAVEAELSEVAEIVARALSRYRPDPTIRRRKRRSVAG